MIRVLVIDDEEPMRRLLKKELERKGFSVETAVDGASGLALLRKSTFDIILLDIMMPGIDGISVLKKIKTDPAAPEVIVLTGKATVETAVEAMKHGAYDYLTKPYKLDELELIIHRAAERRALSTRTQALEQELIRLEEPFMFVHKNKHMKDIISLIKKTAPTDSPVLIQGESGTGKELIANAVWQYSKRKSMPFIVLNCASLSENLIESELFGHEKGAFTSAFQTKHGIVEAANDGTLFLDEIGEMPLGLQAKLLRFLDSGEFRRVGGNKAFSVNVRICAATNRDLTEALKRGSFREDLYYRLNVISIVIPPLRERKEDIPELARHFVKKYSLLLSRDVKDISTTAMEMLTAYTWPGNVRELENLIERAVILSDSAAIGPDDLALPAEPKPNGSGEHVSLVDMEREHILKVLEETGGNQSRASQVLGIDRKTLYNKIRKYGIESL